MTSHAQHIENIIQQHFGPVPAPASDSLLAQQLKVAQTALGRVQLERNRLEAENTALHDEVAFLTKQNNQFVDQIESMARALNRVVA